MKHFFSIAIIAVIMAACGHSKNPAGQTQTAGVTQGEAAVEVFDLDNLLAVADQKVGQTVKVKGYVTHTCKHSGKHCFIVGENDNTSLRVEAKGDIGGFNRELIGSQLEITGTLRENRLTKEYLEQSEKDLNEKKKTEDGSAEACEAELGNIAEMRAKMQELGKDYYSVYYIDGTDYEVLE